MAKKTTFERIAYEALNARQKESFNFQKISAVLADYGYTTIRLSDDWNGADFLAQHLSGETLKIQLKGRLSFYEKYRHKELWVCFRQNQDWYLYRHDELLEKVLEQTNIANSASWMQEGGYTFPGLTVQLQAMLAPYLLSNS